jgi:hypothetical protein
VDWEPQCITSNISQVALDAIDSVHQLNTIVISACYWSATVQALVNVGRTELAKPLGLSLPLDIKSERRLWWSLSQAVYNNVEQAFQKLDRFRLTPENKIVPPEAGPGVPERVRTSHQKDAEDNEDHEPEEN